MRSKYNAVPPILAVSLMLALSACSYFNKLLPSNKDIDYKSSKQQKPLDIPPDLTQPAQNNSMDVPNLDQKANTYSAYHGHQDKTRSKNSASGSIQPDVRYRHEGTLSWLELKGTRQQVWPLVREFWMQKGFVLVVDKPKLGILETEWAENRAKIPQDTVTKFIGSVLGGLYSTGTRDKFRVRLEPGAKKGVLELFVAHQGMVENIVGDITSSEGTVWEHRPSDPGLEAKMLKLMMVYLGIQQKQAATIIASKKDRQPNAFLQRNEQNQGSLVLKNKFARAWRLVGLALDRVSFTVVDRNRSKGIYFVRYSDPDRDRNPGFFAKLWAGKKEEERDLYQVKLTAEQNTVRVVVRDDKGKPANASISERILKLLFEQLK